MCFDPEMRVRDYNNGQSYEFTIKNNMSNDGLIRDEVNIDIKEGIHIKIYILDGYMEKIFQV